MVLSQKSVKSHVENHVNDEYYKCCFEICLIIYLCINQKLILIFPNPLIGYKLTTTFGYISPSKKDWHRGSPLFLKVKALEEKLCDISLKQHHWCCWKDLDESDLIE